MKFFSFFKKKEQSRDFQSSDIWQAYLRQATSVSTEGGVNSIATAYRCIAVISETVGQLSGDVCVKRDGKTERPEHVLNEVLFIHANKYTNAYNFRRQLVYDYLHFGNGFAIIERDGNNKVKSLTNKRMEVYESDGFIFYKDTETGLFYDYEDVIHLADISNNVRVGKSRIAQHAATFGKAKASLEYVNLLYTNNMTLGGVIEYPEAIKLPLADKQVIGNDIKENYGGANKGKVLVLDQGAKFKSQDSSMPLADAEYILSEHLTIEEVCRIFGVPPFKVFHFNKMTYDNMEAMKVEFVESCILPIVIQLEQEINSKLFTAGEKLRKYFVTHEIKSLLRADIKSQAEYFSKMISTGKYSINEVRALDDQDPVQGGDAPLIQANNYMPLHLLEQYTAAMIDEKKAKAEQYRKVTEIDKTSTE